MANTRNRNMIDTVRSTIGQFTGNRGSGSRGRNSRGRGNLASQATGFIGGFLSGGSGTRNSRTRGGGRSRRRSRGGRRR
jgi:hypothetical protein